MFIIKLVFISMLTSHAQATTGQACYEKYDLTCIIIFFHNLEGHIPNYFGLIQLYVHGA